MKASCLLSLVMQELRDGIPLPTHTILLEWLIKILNNGKIPPSQLMNHLSGGVDNSLLAIVLQRKRPLIR